MNPIFAFASSSSGKICLNLLDENHQIKGWFVPFMLIAAVGFCVCALRFLSGAESRGQASGRAVAGTFFSCVAVVVIGWTMFQFFDPTC